MIFDSRFMIETGAVDRRRYSLMTNAEMRERTLAFALPRAEFMIGDFRFMIEFGASVRAGCFYDQRGDERTDDGICFTRASFGGEFAEESLGADGGETDCSQWRFRCGEL